MTAAAHIPVMIREVMQTLQPRDGDVIVDGTFGAGGYTRAILDAADTTVIAFDRDADAIERGRGMAQQYGRRLILVHDAFSSMPARLREQGITAVNGIVLDIGVSSPQIDQPDRGFSFRDDGPLDMRMDRSQETSAADIVNNLDEKGLADIIYRYGEERRSRAIARAIVGARAQAPVTRTRQLADLVARVVPASRKDAMHPATRTFQALRIAVNDELGELEAALQASLTLLRAGGRLVVVTFHSLEDRIVKQFMARETDSLPSASRHLPQAGTARPSAHFDPITRKALTPGEDEIAANPRSRSAKLRAAMRTTQPYAEAA